MHTYFKDNHVVRNPSVVPVNNKNFYVCVYSGALIETRVGIPEFLLNAPTEPGKREGSKNDDKQRMWGAFRDWNTLARFILDGLEQKVLTHEHKDAIFSWISSFTEYNENITIPPSRESLERFGGQLTDDEFMAKYTRFNAKCISVEDDLMMRSVEASLRKEKTAEQPPKLAGAIKDLLLPGQLTHLHMTVATPSVFWVERASNPWAPPNVENTVLKTAQMDWALTGAKVVDVPSAALPAEFYGPKKCPRNVARMFPRPIVAPTEAKKLPASHVNPVAKAPKKRSASGANKKDITGAPVSSAVSVGSPSRKAQKVAIETD